jgi:integrase
MVKSRKSAPIPILVDGVQVGSIRLRYRTWQFRHRANGVHKDVTLRGIRDLEEAIHKAKVIAAQAPPIPSAAPALPSTSIHSLEDALDAYEEQYAKQNRKSSLSRTMPTLRAFVEWIGKDRRPYCLVRQHLIAWRDQRAEKVSRATVNSDLQRMKAFVNWLRAEGLVEGDPTFKVRKMKVPSIAKEAMSPETVEATLKALEAVPWLRDYAAVLANVGLRPQEALHIRSCDVDDKKQLLRIRAYPGWEIKDYEDRTLALNDTAYAILLRLKLATAAEKPVFASPEGKAWEYRNFATRAWRVSLPADLKGIAPYAFRHYFATQAVARGMRIEALSRYLGHQSVLTTQRYYADMRAMETGAPPVTTQPSFRSG